MFFDDYNKNKHTVNLGNKTLSSKDDFLKKIVGILNLDKTADEIFTDPANHNFTMKIDDRIGDPRWYKAE